MTVKEIVKKWLKDNGYGGLYAPGTCACELDDLMPCVDCCMDCKPGYYREPTEQERDTDDLQFLICEEKP